MPRAGLNYETIKLAATKLLSQGTAPSVQRLRDVLGTGSNTTIAQHLKTWREEYASKAIHHLPANMPKELISAMEVLWQTAMDQACEQLASVKHELKEQQETLRLEKTAIEKAENDLRARLTEAQQRIQAQNAELQTLQTQLAVLQAQLKQQHTEKQTAETQYTAQLNRVYNEKNSVLDNNEKLQQEIVQLKKTIDDQLNHYQTKLHEERTLQDESERRWVKLIDQARTEASQQRKHSDQIITQQNAKIEKLNTLLINLQQNQAIQRSALKQKEAHIRDLSDQNRKLHEKYHNATVTIAGLQERLTHRVTNTSVSPKNSRRKESKVAEQP